MGGDAFDLDGASWASGYYVAEFILDSGFSTSVAFIVRSASPDPAAILVMAPTNTWQAYNYWGGHSLYTRGAVAPAQRVSYDRPYVRRAPALFRDEFQLIRYLEREGRSLEYTTNVDVYRDPASVGRQKLAVSVGHDEYWSMPVRSAFDNARDAGTKLAFLGSNSAYWHVRSKTPNGRWSVTRGLPTAKIPDFRKPSAFVSWGCRNARCWACDSWAATPIPVKRIALTRAD